MLNASNRDGELGNVPPRTDRFYAVQGEWFFATREGTPIGPFENKFEADRGLKDFIEFMELAEPKMLNRFYESLTA